MANKIFSSAFRTISVLLLLVLISYQSLCATNYYVTIDGDNDNDGLSEVSAWQSIDNGDIKGILMPGDTVNIIANTYIIPAKIDLTTNGTASNPIVYQNYEDASVILDAEGNGFVMIESNGDHVVIKGLELANAGDVGIHVKGDSTTITECFVHHSDKAGFRNDGKYNFFLRDIAAFCGEEGFKNEGGGDVAVYHHDVAYSCSKNGFELKSDDSRVFNCIAVLNNKGIHGNDKNICGYNDVWGSLTSGYDGGAVDSAGSISSDPFFVNPEGNNFKLQGNSPCINTGLDLGYPYIGSAPDMGAIESNFSINTQVPVLATIGSKTVNEGLNLNFDIYATDADGTTPSLSVENIPTKASFIDHEDGTGTFDFNPDYTQAGIYNVLFMADDEAFVDSEMVAITVFNVNRSPEVIEIVAQTVDEGDNLTFTITASDPDETIPTLSADNVPPNAMFDDNDDGTGTFEFNPDYIQAGIYDVKFIADDSELADTITVQITVVQDPINRISITPDSAIISADSTVKFTVLGLSSTLENRDPGNITWELSEPLGTIDSSGLFEAITVGVGSVIASSEFGFNDTAYLEVTPGVLATLMISPNRDTISADSVRQFSAAGFDSDGNSVSVLGNLSWEVLYGIGKISSGGLFDAQTVGNGFIRVSSDIGPLVASDTITIIPGEPSYLDVVPDENLITENESYQFNAFQFDSDSNLIATVTNASSWTTTDVSGSVSAAGLYTAGNVPSPPVYYVRAIESGMADSSEVTVLSSGSLAYVRIEHENGTIFGDTSLTTDNDTTLLYCRGYDSGNSLLGEISVDWSLNSSEPIGSVIAGPSAHTTLTLSQIGTGKIVARYSEAITATSGLITCLAGVPARLVISPDTATLTTDSTLQFETQTYDADNNISTAVTIDSWNVIGKIGNISDSGLFDPISAGFGQIACTGGGLTDTTGNIVVQRGVLNTLVISPDSIDVSVGSTVTFTTESFDADVNIADVGSLTWSVVGNIGVIDSDGVFTAQNVGSGRIAVTSDINGITDTNQIVNVLAGALEIIIVTPDTASLEVSENVTFIASGFDNNFEPMPMGDLTWEVIGGIGMIDDEGVFTATAKGAGKIAVFSSINGVADTTNMIVVEIPTIAEIPLGNQFVQPNQNLIPILAFKISNAFDEAKRFSGITFNNASRGAGTKTQVLSNFDSLTLYLDSDYNSILTASDLAITHVPFSSDPLSVSFSAVNIPPAADRTFFVGLKTSYYPHDGDSLDIFLRPATDIVFSDGTEIAGPDSINSLGCNIIDGMVADQIDNVSAGNSSITPGNQVSRVMTLDIPRNGYKADYLRLLSLYNEGTAGVNDIDSLLIYEDDGDDVWSGASNEIYQGKLAYTGDQWSISGLNILLSEQVNRFYVGVDLSEYPSNGATIALSIPLKGIEMNSDNDGPVDIAVGSQDTITIVTSETISAQVINIGASELIPGTETGPLVGIEFVNGLGEQIQIDSLRLKSYASDPDGATQSELDSQIDSLILWLNRDGDYREISASDSIIGSSNLNNGFVFFHDLDLQLAGEGGTTGFVIEAVLNSANAKNNNSINFGIDDPDDIYTSQALVISGDFPLKNNEQFSINAFPAENITINLVEGENLFGGQSDRLVFDFELPGDGYADANLQSLKLINLGTSNSNDALESVKLWQDTDLNGLSDSDVLLGEMEYVSQRWQITGLNCPWDDAVNRFLVSVDIISEDFEGGTLQFAIPIEGVQYESGTNGPDDIQVANPESHFLLPTDRITIISIPQSEEVVYPGSSTIRILSFALYNGYIGKVQEFKSVHCNNNTITASDADFADYELGQISLYYDNNANRVFDDDSLIAVGYFSGGELVLNGINIKLNPEMLSYFFLVADIPINAIDADQLSISIENPSDFTFGETVNLNGDLPLTRGSDVIVNGSVKRQYRLPALPNQSLSPGDLSVPLFAFKPAVNGNLLDVLESLTIDNAGSADYNDISSMTLWQDTNEDDLWQATDYYIGTFTAMESNWMLAGLEIDVSDDPQALFVVGQIALSAQPGRTIRLGVPLNGCGYESANDGPLESALRSERTYIISSSGLRIAYQQLDPTYIVGQEIKVLATVTNLTTDTIPDVICDINVNGDIPALNTDSSDLGPKAIPPGENTSFYVSYTSVDKGNIFWQLQAHSENLADSSAMVITDTIKVQVPPQNIVVNMISTIPTSVIRGQTHVFPFSLSYAHPDTSDDAAAMQFNSLRISVKDEFGTYLPAADLFSRIIVSSGYSNLVILEDVPDESSLLLEFASPTILYPGQKQLLSIMVDIDSLAEAGEFILSIENPADINFVENITQQPVTLASSLDFPMHTASCRIDIPSEYMAVSYIPVLNENVNYGQNDVNVLKLILRHPGEAQNSQIQLAGLSVEFLDFEGEPIEASEVIEEVTLLRNHLIIGYAQESDLSSLNPSLQINAPPVLSPGEIDTLDLMVSLSENTSFSGFELRIADSTVFTFRDLSSGLSLITASDKDPLPAETVFPMLSGFASFKYPSGVLNICGSSSIPVSIVGGAHEVELFAFDLEYPSSPDYSAIMLREIEVIVLDTFQKALDPSEIFDRIGFRYEDNPIEYQSFIELRDGRAVFGFGDAGINIDPGQTISLQVIADFESDAPYDHFMLSIEDGDGLTLLDAVDTTNRPALAVSLDCIDDFPYFSPVIKILLPAGKPIFQASPLPTQIGFPGQTGITLIAGQLQYNSGSQVGEILFESLQGSIYKRSDSGLEKLSWQSLFKAVHVYLDDRLYGTDSILSAGNITIDFTDQVVLAEGDSYEFNLICDLTETAVNGNYAIALSDSTTMIFRDKNLGDTIYLGNSGELFPYTSIDLSLTASSLEGSFSNYPNPFNPDVDGFTRIAYVLNEGAEVEVEIYSITGESIKKIVSGAYRGSGSYNQDTWMGLNENGLEVIPGTYFCQITARYDSGRIESYKRKISIIR